MNSEHLAPKIPLRSDATNTLWGIRWVASMTTNKIPAALAAVATALFLSGCGAPQDAHTDHPASDTAVISAPQPASTPMTSPSPPT